MASTKDTADAPVNKLADGGDHDRVVMLSLKADGTPDQTNPEIIGDKDVAVEAAKEQFRQQAVAAVDAVRRPELNLGGEEPGSAEPTGDIKTLKDEHEKAEAAAEKRAEAVVNSLHQG